MDNLSVALGEKSARVKNSLSPDIRVEGIASQLILVFQNLIGNAVKFQKPGVVPEVVVSSRLVAKDWIISVSDNGIGFDPKYEDRIFLVFKRLHSDEKHYPGTGMGLAICKKIIEQHRGRIWAESTPGSGSTFSFAIPHPDAAGA